MRGLHAPFIRRIEERLSVWHVSGDRRPLAKAGSVTLLTRVENGAYYLPEFLAHYRRLGVGHMIFLDTGSADGTAALLENEPDVTVFATTLPFKTHRLWMQRWLMDRVPRGSWVLNVDIDELLDYPRSDRVPLPSLVSYLETHGFSALRAHMLDMFASGPVGTEDAPAPAPLVERYPWYDLSAVVEISADGRFGDMPAYQGGIRMMVSGRKHFWLTKHPLVKTGSGIESFTENEHMACGARCADVTGALLHFKFTPNFRAYVEDAVRRKQHWNDSFEYRLYLDLLSREPDLCLKRETARHWRGVNALVPEGMLVESLSYREWCVAEAGKPADDVRSAGVVTAERVVTGLRE